MDLNLKDIIENKEFHYHRFSSLVFLIIFFTSLMLTVIFPFLYQFFPPSCARWALLSILVISLLILALHWHKNRNVFPKGGDKSNIVVAIITENLKQKSRISTDFVRELKNHIQNYGLNDSYGIIVTHNAQSEKISRIVDEVFYENNDKPDFARFNSMCKRMNAKLIIHGTLVTREAPNNKYILNIRGLVKHIPIPAQLSNELQKEFNEVWEKELSFLEESESIGFKTTSDQIFFAASFMLSFAALIDLNFEKSIMICKALNQYISENKKYLEHSDRIKKILTSNYLIKSKILYLQGNFDGFMETRKELFNIVPFKYDEYNSEAIFHATVKNDMDLALEFIEKAESVAKGDGVWRYNKFYILLQLKRFPDALKVLDTIIKVDYPKEFETINEVIHFNINRHKSNPNHIESFFIIGVLVYKKLNNIPVAYEHIERFLSLTEGNGEWEILRNRAEFYMRKLKKELRL